MRELAVFSGYGVPVARTMGTAGLLEPPVENIGMLVA
jgi:hypothetical protein